MERNRSGRSLAALLASLVLTCAVAHAQSDTPPTRRARLGLAIANLDQSWRDANRGGWAGLLPHFTAAAEQEG